MPRIHQYGLYRTGTNYINWLLKNNFKDIYIIPDGKHEAPIYRKNWLFMISYKEPFSWIHSFKKYMLNERRRTITIDIAIEWYNDINKRYVNFYNRNRETTVLVNYMSLLKNYRAVLIHIEKKFKLERSQERFINAQKVMHRGNGFFDDAPNFNKGFYYNKRYMDFFNVNQALKIKDRVDPIIEDTFLNYSEENYS